VVEIQLQAYFASVLGTDGFRLHALSNEPMEKDANFQIGWDTSVYPGADLDVWIRKNLFRRESKFDFLVIELLAWPLY
jgi:hypothetical protein